MKASQPTVPNGSSAPLISGFPVVIPAVEWFEENISDLLIEAVDDATKDATERLRDKASDIEGWDAVAGALSVKVSDGEIVVGQEAGSPELNEYINALEYGVNENPPSPLLRKTLSREEKRIPTAIHRALEEDLPVA